MKRGRLSMKANKRAFRKGAVKVSGATLKTGKLIRGGFRL